MDQQTLEFYDRAAAETAAKHRAANVGAWRQQFQEAFPAGGRVLDVGSGSGRDLALLLELGFDAYGTEPSPGMRTEAIRALPQLAGRLFPFGLPLSEDAEVVCLRKGPLRQRVTKLRRGGRLYSIRFRNSKDQRRLVAGRLGANDELAA